MQKQKQQKPDPELAKLVARNRLLRKRCKAATAQLSEAARLQKEERTRRRTAAAQGERDLACYGDDFDEKEAQRTFEKLTEKEASLFARVSDVQREHAALVDKVDSITQSRVQKDGNRLRARCVDLDLEIERLREEKRTMTEVLARHDEVLADEERQNEPMRRQERELQAAIESARHEMRRAASELPTFASSASGLRAHEELVHVHCENDSLVRTIKVHEAIAADFVSTTRQPSPRKARHTQQILQRELEARRDERHVSHNFAQTTARICAQLRQRCKELTQTHASRMAVIQQRHVLWERLERELGDLRARLASTPPEP